ncbi:type III pantothenate kinase [Candidatus Margulisiibacteriota bacterium]
MLLTIDIGNTNIHCGLFFGKHLKQELRFKTKEYTKLAKLNWAKIDKAIVSSVVPALDNKIKKLVKCPIKFVRASNLPILKIKTKNINEVGADRLVNAVAGYKLYKSPLMIIDFGTATTLCAITARGEYLGGIIAPGIELSRHVLHEKTAKLPLIKLKKPIQVIGKDTTSAMRSGLVLGYTGMVEGLLMRLEKELKNKYKQKNIKIIATGGYAPLISKMMKRKIHIMPELTLSGLQIIAEEIF